MFKRFFSFLIILNLFFVTLNVSYAIDQEVIKARVLEVVEERGSSQQAVGSSEGELEMQDERTEIKRDFSTGLEMTTHTEISEDRVLWSGVNGVIQVRRVEGQWYLSFHMQSIILQ